jgi:16S rRNA (uracil1498-N3)-methyltransferase
MDRRFFSESPILGPDVVLEGPEAHHLIHVVRLAVGDTVSLFDGSGNEFQAVIRQISKNKAYLTANETKPGRRELDANLSIAAAMPKGDRQKFLVEKLVELGVAELIPLDCCRSVAVPKPSSIEKMHRWVIEASKQSGRNTLMRISSAESFESLVCRPTAELAKFLAHPGDLGLTVADVVAAVRHSESAIFGVGPEGGFADDEISLAIEHGWKLVSLAKTTLRIETAAIAAATIFAFCRQTYRDPPAS